MGVVYEAVQLGAGNFRKVVAVKLIRRGLEDRDGGYRVQFDFGLMRDLSYYNGAILEVYDPALGHVLGGGGRYDGLMKRFGLDLSAAGFALYLERVHVAQIEERRRREAGR